jgi:TPR repeat protein
MYYLIPLLFFSFLTEGNASFSTYSYQLNASPTPTPQFKTDYERAIAYDNGNGVMQDTSKAFDLFLECAKRGDPKAEYKLGIAYYNGVGVSKDQLEGLAWMYKAVGSGMPRSVCTSMEQSLGTEMSLKARERAKELSSPLLPSAVAGGQAMNPSICGDSGDMSSPDFVKMAEQIRDKALNRKSDGGAKMSDAQMNRLGVQYEKGEGISKNLAAAAEYYRQAADRSYPPAQYNLARLYKNGEGVTQNSKMAFSLFFKAASTGHASSQNQLGVAYALGQGVPKNLVSAYMWFNIAAGNGTKVAAKNRELAAQQMTPYQIQEAQRLSSEWSVQPQATP